MAAPATSVRADGPGPCETGLWTVIRHVVNVHAIHAAEQEQAWREAAETAQMRDGGQADSSETEARKRGIQKNYETGRYWRNRMDLMYYSYIDYIMRTVARDAKSMIDIGTANCPYLEWFDWIDKRVSFDLENPYQSKTVKGVKGDFLKHRFRKRYDVCTCLQVLEHIPDVERFARKLFELSDLVIVSVPYRWPATVADDHIHDPIDYEKLTGWMGREANYHIVVKEPFRSKPGERLIAIYEKGRTEGYGRKDFKSRIRRARFPLPEDE